MEIRRISNGEMPPANKYVLVFVPGRPWCDSTDPNGVFWRVAKLIYAENDFFRKPYYFKEWGPGDLRAEEVDIWCELPVVEVKEEEIWHL